ncbi:hypothetical protein [Micromonospora avicenniae]|uniref:Uncharacterized protein n=1 Tax=Micromonospora avicenniae TaxID=1198245 RepID=A0A1N6WV13_9ACTN|nr:hypothetical protein [Micromonospora avicenniae]SIQ93841.1 hypothetical protein SAMN05444858_105117 [Micromonospora avicenniae]
MNAERMDQETVERLLDSPVDATRAEAHPIVSLLMAVRAEPHPHEFDGEGAAVMAYRRALADAPGPGPCPGTPPVGAAPSPGLVRFGVRAGIVALALAATGGIALATTGTWPGTRPAPPTRAPASPVPAPTASTVPPASTTAPVPSTEPGRTERPAPEVDLPGLCRAYRADDDPGALDSPAFAGLVAAAGGRSRVPGFCDRMLTDGARHATPPGQVRTPSRSPHAPSVTPPTEPPGRPDEHGRRTPPADDDQPTVAGRHR